QYLHCPDGLCRSSNPAAWEAVAMGKQRIKPNYRRRVLRLPDLDHCKTAVLNSLGSPARAESTSTPSTSSSPGTAPSLGWPSTASSSCAIACTWNRGIWPPAPSTSSLQPCVAWLTKPPTLAC